MAAPPDKQPTLPGASVSLIYPERNLTDLGFAQRIKAKHGDDLRFCHVLRQPLVFKEVWNLDETGVLFRMAQSTVPTIYAEAAQCSDKKERDQLADFAQRCEATRNIKAALEQLFTLDGIPILPSEMDTHEMLFAVGNGTLHLETGKLEPFRREHLITKRSRVNYDPHATCPIFDAFLEYVVPNRDERRFLQRYAGYSLTGSVREQVMVVLWGGGANGKSTFLEILRELLGEYGQHAPADTILAKRDTGIPNDIARQRGIRFLTIIETEEGRRIAEVQVKMLTGGDTITARFMRGEWFQFRPTAKIWLASNHRPQIRGTDYAMWRRIRLVPFTVTVPENERDPDLLAKLREELPGILNWALEGCLEWQRDGLKAPDSVLAATEEYRAHEDVLGSWIDERCVVGDFARCEFGALYSSYRSWCEAAGENAMNQRAFGDRLAERGHLPDPQRGTGGRRYRLGIGLHADDQDRDQ